jgi:hypothetical protein
LFAKRFLLKYAAALATAAILAATPADQACSAEFSAVCETLSMVVATMPRAMLAAVADATAVAIAVADAKTFALNFESVPLTTISGTLRNGATGVPSPKRCQTFKRRQNHKNGVAA